jgi:hypothetical protein
MWGYHQCDHSAASKFNASALKLIMWPPKIIRKFKRLSPTPNNLLCRSEKSAVLVNVAGSHQAVCWQQEPKQLCTDSKLYICTIMKESGKCFASCSYRFRKQLPPCRGGLEYHRRGPASRRRRRKGNPVPGDVTGPPCHWRTSRLGGWHRADDLAL